MVIQPSAQQAVATPAMAAPVMPVGGPVIVNPNAPVVSQSAGMLAPSGPPPNFICPCAPATCCCICFDLDTGIFILSGCNGCAACVGALAAVIFLFFVPLALLLAADAATFGAIAYLLFMGPRLCKPMYFQYAAMIMVVNAVLSALTTITFAIVNKKAGAGTFVNILISTAIAAYYIYVVLSKRYHVEQQLSAGGY